MPDDANFHCCLGDSVCLLPTSDASRQCLRLFANACLKPAGSIY